MTQPANQELDLNSVVSGVLALQSLVGGEKVRIDSELDGSLPFIIGDPELLRETLENLLRNAVEALPEGGNVMVRTGWSLLLAKSQPHSHVQSPGDPCRS